MSKIVHPERAQEMIDFQIRRSRDNPSLMPWVFIYRTDESVTWGYVVVSRGRIIAEGNGISTNVEVEKIVGRYRDNLYAHLL